MISLLMSILFFWQIETHLSIVSGSCWSTPKRNVSRLFEELGIPGNTLDTYKLATKIKDDIITNNLSLCDKYGLELTVSQMTLPFMYWLPKMHYSPSRARFIVVSSTCSSKPPSQAISKVLKLLFHQVQNFGAKSTFYKNYNRFWVIENSSPIEQLNSLNSKKKAKDISTYDFSTLYTKLKHSDLVQVLEGIIDFAQKGGRRKEDGNRKFVSFSKREAFWCKKQSGKNVFQHAWTQGFNRPSHNWNLFRIW